MPSRTLPILLGLVISVGACSTTRYGGSVVTPAAVADIRAENPDTPLRVELARIPRAPDVQRGSDEPELARLVDVAPDHATLVLSSEVAARVVPNDSIKRIVVIHRSEGALMGAGIGVIVGVAAALAVAGTSSDSCARSTSWGCVDFSSGDMSVLVGVGVGIPAILIGTALGAAISTRTNYTFGPPAADRVN
jgi:hypothetical protein